MQIKREAIVARSTPLSYMSRPHSAQSLHTWQAQLPLVANVEATVEEVIQRELLALLRP